MDDDPRPQGPGGLFEVPLMVLDEVLGAVPKLVERTRSQAELARRVAAHLPCLGGLVAHRAAVQVPAHEASQPVDVLRVVALQSDETGPEAEAEPGDDLSGVGAGAAAERPAGEVPADAGEVREDSPSEGDLPVQDYDSLAASQVVPRLAALTAEELVAVGAYERAHRNRQTILNKVAQLQAR